MQINILQVSYKLILSFLVGVARQAQSIQNNKFAIPLQYLKKKVMDKADFFHEDKFQSLPQVNTINFGCWDQVCPKYPK